MRTDERLRTLTRYTITSEGASKGYFRLVVDEAGQWVTWPEIEAVLAELAAPSPQEAEPPAVTVWAAYVLGGFRRVARTDKELLESIRRGLNLSPIGKVIVQEGDKDQDPLDTTGRDPSADLSASSAFPSMEAAALSAPVDGSVSYPSVPNGGDSGAPLDVATPSPQEAEPPRNQAAIDLISRWLKEDAAMTEAEQEEARIQWNRLSVALDPPPRHDVRAELEAVVREIARLAALAARLGER